MDGLDLSLRVFLPITLLTGLEDTNPLSDVWLVGDAHLLLVHTCGLWESALVLQILLQPEQPAASGRFDHEGISDLLEKATKMQLRLPWLPQHWLCLSQWDRFLISL